MARSIHSFYRPELDVLRFFAFLLIFNHHLLPATNGFQTSVRGACSVGLPLFFLLSAYLITELLLREEEATGTVNFRSFYIRRSLRIWPLYFGFIVVAAIVDRLGGAGVWSSSRLLAFFLMVGNWHTAHTGFFASVAAPLWSISIEEQFYMVWPALQQAGKWPRRLTLTAVPILAYGTIIWLFQQGGNLEIAIWVNTFVQAQYFGAGALLAFALHHRAFKPPAWVRLALLCISVVIIFEGQSRFHVRYGGGTPIGTCFGFACFLLGTVGFFLSVYGYAPVRRLRGFIYLGKISYGLYVFHMLATRVSARVFERMAPRFELPHTFLNIIPLSIILAVCVAMASLSYYFYEKPFLRLKSRFEVIRTRGA